MEETTEKKLMELYHRRCEEIQTYCEDDQDKDDWRLRIKGQPAN